MLSLGAGRRAALAAALAAPALALAQTDGHSARIIQYEWPDREPILQKGGYVPASLRVEDRAQKLPLKFVDPALVLDEDAKWKKLWAEIVLGTAK